MQSANYKNTYYEIQISKSKEEQKNLKNQNSNFKNILNITTLFTIHLSTYYSPLNFLLFPCTPFIISPSAPCYQFLQLCIKCFVFIQIFERYVHAVAPVVGGVGRLVNAFFMRVFAANIAVNAH
jgi:hypothetical protein